MRRQRISEQLYRPKDEAVTVVKVPTRGGRVMTIGLGHYLFVAAVLFTLGILGIFLNRKNVIVILMCVELMLLAVNINLVAFSVFQGNIVGQIFAMLVLTVAAAEAAIGLAILVVYFRNRGNDRGRRHQRDEGLGARTSPWISPSSSSSCCRCSRPPSPACFCRVIGDRPAQIVTCAALLIAAALSIFVFVRIGFGPENAKLVVVKLFTWIDSGTFDVDWSLRVDTLTAVMLIVVTGVSSMVHVYSIGYMAEDPGIPRFMSYLSLFTFFMLMLVTSDNLVQLFFGWEGVGLASYLLIGFWYDRPSANAAAIKAFIVNRVGDFGFALGIFAVWMLSGSVNFDEIFAKGARDGRRCASMFLGMDLPALETACLLLFVGAMGKSAQLGLHTWLPDAMEGPTPVSALIHAATMVTAGVFMVCRLSPLFELAPIASAGRDPGRRGDGVLRRHDRPHPVRHQAGGRLFDLQPARLHVLRRRRRRLFGGDVPPDDPRLLQGAAVPRLGLGHHRPAPRAGHAQDGRREGEGAADLHPDVDRHAGAVGHRRAVPAGQRHRLRRLLLQGHDARIGLSACIPRWASSPSGWASIAAFMTAFYSTRLMFMTFYGKYRGDHHTWDHAHESPAVMLIPLYVLGAGALLSGFVAYDWFVGHDWEHFWGTSIAVKSTEEVLHHAHEVPMWVTLLPLVFALSRHCAELRAITSSGPTCRRAPCGASRRIYALFYNKWYFDEIYDAVFVQPALAIGRFFWKKGDGATIDGLGPDNIAARAQDMAGVLSASRAATSTTMPS